MARRQRWDEASDCEVCKDNGRFLAELWEDTYELVICACPAGDEAHEVYSKALDGWD